MVVRPGDSRRLALAAWSVVHGLSWLVVDGQITEAGFTEDVDELAPKALRVLFRGLAPTP